MRILLLESVDQTVIRKEQGSHSKEFRRVFFNQDVFFERVPYSLLGPIFLYSHLCFLTILSFVEPYAADVLFNSWYYRTVFLSFGPASVSLWEVNIISYGL